MEPTTGLILRRITQTNLSVAAHKLATLILDAIGILGARTGRGPRIAKASVLLLKVLISPKYFFCIRERGLGARAGGRPR